MVSEDGQLVLVADARVDNRAELLGELCLEASNHDLIPDSSLILAAYRRWGEQCVDRLCGDYAFALWDGARRRWFCARDPVGVRSLFYYHREGRVFSCATEIKALLTVPETPRELDEMRVALFLTGVFDDQEITFYRGIRRLAPGHCLRVDQNGCRAWRYWHLDPKHEIRLPSDEEYAGAFLDVFREAVRCRLRSVSPVASALSGGLDSSSITCLAREILARHGGPELHTFSAVFPGLSGPDLRRLDERTYMAAVTELGGLSPHQVEVDRVSPLVGLDRIQWLQDEPIMTPNLYLHWALYSAAQDQGTQVFLDGLDGDTTVSHGYDYLADLARSLRLWSLWVEGRAVASRAPAKRYTTRKVILDFGLKPLVPASLRRLRHLVRRGREAPPWGELALVNKDFAAEVGLAERIRELRGDPFRKRVGARASHLRGLRSPLIAHALEVADRATTAHGLEGRYPFFDRRLMEFCLALPGNQKLRRGWSRYILRQAMEGILPPVIQWRTDKADLSPGLRTGLWSFEAEALKKLSRDESDLARRFVDMPALRATVGRYAKAGGGSNADAFTLYGVAAFLRWLEATWRP